MTTSTATDALGLRAIVCFAGVLVAQRFTLPPLSAAACLIPLLLLTAPAIRARHALTMALIALLASVDLGGEAYVETPGVLRYLLYSVAAATLMGKWRFGRRGDIAVFAYLALLVFNTILHPHALNAHSFSRDLIAVFVGCAVYFYSKPAHAEPLDYGLLGWFCVGVIASELVNILFFYQLSTREYLNYSSFKVLVVMPCLYMLLNRKYAHAIAVGALTLVVLGAYASRMLMLTFLCIVLFILLRDVFLHFRRSTAVFAAALVALVFVVVEYSGIEVDAFRAFAVLLVFADMSDVESLPMLLDPVRFTENSIFFGQGTYHLLFGNGLGSGILDTRGDFAFVPDDGAAFSSKEISDSHFFRLHDSWTWFGYRLGLLPYLLFVAWALKGCLSRQPRTALAATMMLMTMLNATFSIGGLLVCGAFALQYRRELAVERAAARPVKLQPARRQGSSGPQPTQAG